jgi:hypothetical protein
MGAGTLTGSNEPAPEISHWFVNRIEVMSEGKPIIHDSFRAKKSNKSSRNPLFGACFFF